MLTKSGKDVIVPIFRKHAAEIGRVFADATCAYQKLRLILQGLPPAECNNVRCLVFPGYPPQKIDRDVVDSAASRPR